MANPTIEALCARLSPRVASAVAARDAAARSERAGRAWATKRARAGHKAPRTETIAELEARIAALQAELASRRAAEKAARDKRLDQLHAKAKRYRLAHPDVEAARQARYSDAKRRARLAAESCQPSA